MSFDLHTRAEGIILGTFDAFPALHAVATRAGGVSDGPYASLNLGPRSGDAPERVRANRDRFLQGAGMGGARLLAPRQVHSAAVAIYRAADPLPPNGVFEGDALLSDAPGVVLMILAADCVPVLLHDPERGVIGAVHAGWRGTAGAIVQVAVARMAGAFGSRPGALHAALGPAIGRCCYQVGPEVTAALAPVSPGEIAAYCDPDAGGKARLDLTAINRVQLIAAGIPAHQVSVAGLCTACRTDLFYSHRREGEPTGRNGAVIALPP